MVRLFDVKNGKVIPTEHCYTIKALKDIMDAYEFEEEYLKVYEYLFYMTCPNEDLNPFANFSDLEKEKEIIRQIDAGFSTEDDLVIEGLRFCTEAYSTATTRAYNGIKSMLDRLADYMATTP